MIFPTCVAVAIGLAGCKDPSVDLQVRLTHAQTELDAANTEIQKLRVEVDKPREQPAQPPPQQTTQPVPVASEESFREAAKGFAAQLAGELKGATISAPAYSEVKTVASFHFMLTMPDGSVSGQDVVASPTADGRWVFPATGEFVRGLAAATSRQQANATPAPQTAPVAPQPTPQPQPPVNPVATGGPGLPSNETKNIDFGDRPRQPGVRPGLPTTVRTQPPQPPQPQPPTTLPPTKPVQPRTANPALPRADEEVPVSFDKKKK